MKLPINYNRADWMTRRDAREEYVDKQQGKCWYCRKSLDGDPPQDVMSKTINLKLFPPSMFDHPVHLHHNHRTGMTIGAVHSICNAVLWQYHGE